MPLLRIDEPSDPRVADYMRVSDADLLRSRGLFVAEGRLVVARLLEHPSLRARSLLVTPQALDALSRRVTGFAGRLPVYVCELALMREVTGFNFHRGCLALGERPAAGPVRDLLAAAARIVVLEGLGDADNVGSVFRSAAALGADGVLLSPQCCDPLYRKAIRTSMGAALQVPFARCSDWPGTLRDLHDAGFTMVALTPRPDARDIAGLDLPRSGRVALLVGHEGAGLTPEAEALADCRVTIRMRLHVDSLNVATAAAIAMHRLFAGR